MRNEGAEHGRFRAVLDVDQAGLLPAGGARSRPGKRRSAFVLLRHSYGSEPLACTCGFYRGAPSLFATLATITRHGHETQQVMTPMQFMSRLVALIPPPYHPLLRYFGVFGPHSSWRKSVVPDVGPAAEHQHNHSKPSVASTSKPGSSNSDPGHEEKALITWWWEIEGKLFRRRH